MALIINGQDFTKRIVASVWPIDLHESRPLYGGVFKMPAVPRGGTPELLFVEHHQEWHNEPITRRRYAQTITSTEIANDIRSAWSSNGLYMDENSGPGVWTLELPNGQAPDVENGMQVSIAVEHGTAAAHHRQRIYADRKVKAADEVFDETKSTKAIDDTTRVLCRYFGYEREWLHEIKDGEISICPVCSKVSPRTALKCQHCLTVLDPIGLARYEAKAAEDWKKATALERKQRQLEEQAKEQLTSA